MSEDEINRPQIGITTEPGDGKAAWSLETRPFTPSQAQQKQAETQLATAELNRTRKGSVAHQSRCSDVVTPATFCYRDPAQLEPAMTSEESASEITFCLECSALS